MSDKAKKVIGKFGVCLMLLSIWVLFPEIASGKLSGYSGTMFGLGGYLYINYG